MKQFNKGPKKALVIGGSISGLLAARVLSDFCEEVTIVEKDAKPAGVGGRRGVPQGPHAHGLLASGSRELEGFFPGFSEDLIARGALSADVVNDGRWFFEGAPLARAPSGTIGILVSRPFLEAAVRASTEALERVRIIDNCRVMRLIGGGDRIRGLITDSGPLYADLVVDASGRGSQSDKWLKSAGCPIPSRERIDVQLCYSTRYFRRRETDMEGLRFTIVAASPENKRSGVILAQEGGRWVVTLIGRFGAVPPAGLDDFIAYAKTLDAPYIYDTIRSAEPLGGGVTMRYPESVRRRFEKLRRHPAGFLAFGDAICSFNPVYGQGMSVAALQARVLHNVLSSNAGLSAERFYRAASTVIDTPWSIAAGGDLRMPEFRGKRPLGKRLLNWYISRLHRFAHHDPGAAVTFLRVAQLIDPPSVLLSPKLALRALTASKGGLRYSRNSGLKAPAAAERG